MALTLTELVAKMDALYGAAYTSLTDTLGVDINAYSSVRQEATNVKAAVRGGSDLIGVIDTTASDFAVGAFSTPTYSVYVNNGSVYFNGTKKTIAATTTVNIGLLDGLGNSVASYVSPLPNTGYAAYITVQDNVTPTVMITKGINYSYGTDNITTCPLPSYPRNEIPVAKVYINRTGGATAINDIRNTYAAAPSDALVLGMFSSVDTVENGLNSKSFKSDFASGLSSLDSYCVNQTGQSLKTYFAANTWTDGFKQLYADQNGVDLRTNLYSIAPSGTGNIATVYGNVLKVANTIQAITDSANTTWSATTQVQIYAVQNAGALLSAPAATVTGYTSLSIANLTASSTFPVNGGYGAVSNYDGTFDWFSYGISNASQLATVLGFVKTHKSWDSVYNVELMNVYIASGALQNVAYSVGTSGSKYLGIALATISTAGIASCRVRITNV